MGDFFTKFKDWWANAELSHKAFAVGGAALFGVLLVSVFLFAGRPHMSLLFSGLPATEQGAIVQELDKAGIKNEGNERGDVLVPNDRLAEARMKLAVANKLPAAGGFTDFDKEISSIGLMNTPPVEKERLKGILEQRIAESIQSIEGISAARVHIVLAEDKAFISDAKPATASITITQAANAMISKDQGRAIAILTANSVPGLTLANVAVLNNRMEMLYDGHDLDSPTGSGTQRFAAEDLESRKYADNLQRHLDQVYGPGAALVSVHMELDFNQVHTITDAVTPTDPVPIDKTTEKMDGKKPTVGGASGAVANTQPLTGAPASSTNASNDTSYTNTHTQFQTGATNTHVSKDEAPGSVKAMGINVIANSDRIADAGPLTEIIDGELGPRASDPNFTRKVTLVKFDTTVAKAEAQATAAAAANQRVQQLIAMIPMVALIGVGFFVLRQVIKITKPQPAVVESMELASLPTSTDSSEAIDMGHMHGMEISPEALMEANGGVLPEGVKINPHTGLVVLDGTENLSEEDRLRIVKGITAKVNVPLEQIKRMCQDRPEAVAMLIKGWLLEEKRA